MWTRMSGMVTPTEQWTVSSSLISGRFPVKTRVGMAAMAEVVLLVGMGRLLLGLDQG